MLAPGVMLDVSMSFSSGTRTALGEAASWIFAGVCLIASFFYFDELKAAISPVPQGEMAVGPAQNVRSQHASFKQPSKAIPQPAPSSAGYLVELAVGPNGHYRTAAHINGRSINVLVDTGATYVALTYDDAERTGIFVNDSDFKYKVQTANGYARIAVVMIDRVAIGDIEVRNIKATVAQRGKLHVTLLGMSFLGKLRRAEMQRGRLILEN